MDDSTSIPFPFDDSEYFLDDNINSIEPNTTVDNLQNFDGIKDVPPCKILDDKFNSTKDPTSNPYPSDEVMDPWVDDADNTTINDELVDSLIPVNDDIVLPNAV